MYCTSIHDSYTCMQLYTIKCLRAKTLSLSENVAILDRIHAPCTVLPRRKRPWRRHCRGNCQQTVEPTVTHAAARHAVQVLERYFMEQGFNETLTAALDACSDAVRRKASASTKQTTLDRFFSWTNCSLLHVCNWYMCNVWWRNNHTLLNRVKIPSKDVDQ